MINHLALKLFNLILETNQSSLKKLAKQKGKTFYLVVPGFSINGQIDHDGYIIKHTGNKDVIINIPLNSASYLIDRDKLAIYKKISFEGDTSFGRELLEIFSNLHINGLYTKINSPTMLVIYNQIIKFLKNITSYLKHISQNTIESVKEYLLYETEDLITRFENDEFCQKVDELNSRTEHLEWLIQNYTKVDHK